LEKADKNKKKKKHKQLKSSGETLFSLDFQERRDKDCLRRKNHGLLLGGALKFSLGKINNKSKLHVTSKGYRDNGGDSEGGSGKPVAMVDGVSLRGSILANDGEEEARRTCMEKRAEHVQRP
jgi:hypothetical protein